MSWLIPIVFFGFLRQSPARTPWEHFFFALPFAIGLTVQLVAVARGARESDLEWLDRQMGWYFRMIVILGCLVMLVVRVFRGDGWNAAIWPLMALLLGFFTVKPKR